MPSLHTFDVFDTLITRPFVDPIRLFDEIARAAASRGVAVSVDAFVAARVQAEKRARVLGRKRGLDDIGLAEIYAALALPLSAEDRQRLLELEVEVELHHVRPIGPNIERVRGLLAQGQRVLFLSDMYLPRGAIAAMLRAAGLACADEQVFTSGDVGLGKYTGRLFDHVRELERMPASDCHHVGDNRVSDWERPRQRGWDAELYTGSHANRFERCVPGAPVCTSRFGGVSRIARMQTAVPDPLASICTGAIGPLLVASVADVLVQAQGAGLDRLYFVSRDGQIFLKVAQQLQAAGLGAGLELRYLLGSRQAWFLPSVVNGGEAELHWAFTRGMSSAPIDIFRRLDLDEAQLGAVLQRIGASEHDPSAKLRDEQFMALVRDLTEGALHQQVLEHASRRRDELGVYLREQGLLDTQREYALVDVGWTLKGQAALARILRAMGDTRTMRGYYLGIVNNHEPLSTVGRVRAFVAGSKSQVEACHRADWFLKRSSMLLVEHLYTLADHPGLERFRASGDGVQAVFKPDHRSPEQVAFTARVHACILDYARAAAADLGDWLASAEFGTWALANAHEFWRRPTGAEADAVGWLSVNREQGHDPRHESRLAAPLTYADVWQSIKHDLLLPRDGFTSSNFSWSMGALALSRADIRAIFRTFELGGRAVGTLRRLRGEAS